MYFLIAILGNFLLFLAIFCDIAEDIVYYIVCEIVYILLKIWSTKIVKFIDVILTILLLSLKQYRSQIRRYLILLFTIFLAWNIAIYLKCLSEPLQSNSLVYGLISTKFFSFNWKIFIWNNCLIIIHFVILICCKINFDIIWYSVVFAANLYLSIFVWSSDILNFVFMNVVILV